MSSGDAIGDDPRLAAARSREDEKGAAGMRYGRRLWLVQLIGEHRWDRTRAARERRAEKAYAS